MATPTPFSALTQNTWQIPNPIAQQQASSLPGSLSPFWGGAGASQSQSAAAAQNLRTQLAASPASPMVMAGTRMTMDIAAQFCLGLALLITILTHQ
ncbi:hypothetical protein WJX74_006977 [Apatococcus lobatus]|uniref:Uncharacterized protein n=1 Tax=Apatococcus lobatus TaxID=904363 RepID=A0AAW1Q4J0_9CHLO